ncbi:MAG: Na+/H+ antiporter NhaA [Pseudomonadota bacterium]
MVRSDKRTEGDVMSGHKKKSGAISFLLENSLFLIAGASLALVWANLDHHSYGDIAHNHGFHFAVNDVLMAFFFLLAGKEIREAMLPGGALSTVRTASLPLMATIGGMAGPAIIYFVGAKMLMPELTPGWAIPMATDIAFAYLVAKLIWGHSDANGKTPAPIIFLLLLAIADDAGGLIVLAIFYPQPLMVNFGEVVGSGFLAGHQMVVFSLFVGTAIALSLLFWKKLRIHNFWAYLLVPGVLSWFGFFFGGIHPALALVPLAWCMPHEYADLGIWAPGESNRQDTLNKMEHWWKNPVEIVLGLFGFVNAGVALSAMGTGTWLVFGGLLVGKPVGIVLMTKLGQLMGLKLPEGMGTRDLLVVGMAAAIGFTVALFVSVVAFPAGELLDSVKMGALFSFSAAILTFAIAKILGIKRS